MYKLLKTFDLKISFRQVIPFLAATLLAIPAVFSYFPKLNVRGYEFIKQNWQWGWILTFLLGIVLSYIWLKLPISDDKKELLIKDLSLLEERLTGLEPNSRVMNFLSNEVLFIDFPTKYLDFLEDKELSWQADTRELRNRSLRKAFKAINEATGKFVGSCLSEMWTKDESSGGDIDDLSMYIPPEWKHTDPARYLKANKELTAELNELVSEIRNMHKLMHDLRPLRPFN